MERGQPGSFTPSKDGGLRPAGEYEAEQAALKEHQEWRARLEREAAAEQAEKAARRELAEHEARQRLADALTRLGAASNQEDEAADLTPRLASDPLLSDAVAFLARAMVHLTFGPPDA
jgi:hypothetical protein